MRKNTARHWLHAALDLLPVILIPVFMIYSHRHVLTERTEVEIQYKYQSNEVNTIDDWVIGNVYSMDFFNLSPSDIMGGDNDYIIIQILSNAEIGYVTLDEALPPYILNSNVYLTLYSSDSVDLYIDLSDDYIMHFDNFGDLQYPNTFNVVLIDFEIDNLFYNPFSYTDYNEIESVDVQDTNSDIMSVFMEDFNYTVNKYFNMGNVFNLKDVYHWFEVNIFNNNPPVVMASIYNIIVYEFVMDLLFLLYGLFMWFVDMLKRLIEKPINSIK